MIRSFAALSLLLVSTTALAQRPARGGGGRRRAGTSMRRRGSGHAAVPIRTDEGTWMNVDVSPDGRTLAFDLLGDIYTMPIAGGTPTRISSGLAFDMQPRFSPDGRLIAFTSDRGGGDNIWVMNADGTGARAITRETFRLLNAPTWSPDGQYIAARKHFTTQRSLGTGEIWLYHVSGVGEGVPLVERPNPQFQKELGEPAFAPDGRSIYFSRNTTPGNTFEYAQDSNQQVFAIERYDMRPAERTQVAGGPGGAVRPTPSPDGRWLAYVHRTGGRSRLFVKDLHSGEERQVYADLDQDLQETWAVHGVYPNMDWTPDSNSDRLLGRRQAAPGQPRRRRRRRNPVPGQRHPHRHRSAAARRSRSRRPTSPPGCRASPPSRRTAAGSSTRRSAGSTSATFRAARRAC